VGRLGLGLGLGLALGLQLGIGIGLRRNHSWSSIFTPRRNHCLCLKHYFANKKTIKNMFCITYIKTLKTCIKTLNYSIHSSKKHRQYK